MNPDRAAFMFQARPKFRESKLGMIPRANRLDDRCNAVGKQSREQNRGLYLRAGDGQRVFDRR